MLKCGTVVDL